MINRETQRRVWSRIYGAPMGQKWSRQQLQQCLRREQLNYDYYDRLRMDPTYGPAFARLADDAMEHMKMLRQILKG